MGALFSIGIIASLTAVFLVTVTLANGDYRLVLLSAIALAVVADGIFATLMIRGPWKVRIAALICSLPSVYVIANFAQRAPHVF